MAVAVARLPRKPRPAFTDADKKNAWKVLKLNVLRLHVPLGALRRVEAPAFIIAGDRDVITLTLEHTVAVYRHLRRAWRWIVPTSGHATLHEHAAEFNRQVDSFFQARSLPPLPH